MAIKFLAGNKLTGLEADTPPDLTTDMKGATFFESDTQNIYIWSGSAWVLSVANELAQDFSLKTFTDSVIIEEISTPGNAPDDAVRLYAKSGGRLYSKDASGNEYDLTAGAGSTSTISGASDTDISSASSAHVLIYDGTNSWDNKPVSGDVTISAAGATTLGATAITGQTAETTPQGASDFVLIYDNSNSALRKMTVSNLLAGGVSADTLAALNDTTIASVGSAQMLIYDGSDSWDNKTISGGATINTSGVLTLAASQTGITAVGALNTGSITSGFTSIDVGSGAITTTGTITAGNLVVSGTSTTVNTATMTVQDPIIHLQTASGGGNLSADTNKDVGIAMEYHNGSAAKEAFLGWDDSAGKLTFIPDATLNAEVVSGSVGTIVANLEGNVTGAVTGNADTATSAATLTTPRDIGGVSFNGSADINLPGVNGGGNQNTSGTAAGLSATLAVTSGGTGQTSYTKGDLIAANSSTLAKLAVGSTTGHVLTVDPAEATGMKWAAASGGEMGSS